MVHETILSPKYAVAVDAFHELLQDHGQNFELST